MPNAALGRVALTIGVVCSIAAFTGSRAQQASTVPAAEALQRLESHRGYVEGHKRRMDAAYDYATAAETMIAGFKLHGVSQEMTDRYARVWSGSGLAYDYVWARKSVYEYHSQALADSISHVRAKG